MKKFIKVITLFAVLFFISNESDAQFGNGNGSVTPGSNPLNGIPLSGVPFDGGLSLILIAAGAGVAKRRRQNSLRKIV